MESPAPASSRIKREAAGRAVDALLKWMREQAKQRKAQLLEHDDLLNLVLTLKRIPPSGRTNPYLIPLPHPLFDPAATSICIIIDDRPSSRVTHDAVRAAIKSAALPIDKVISLSDLRSDYRPFEARRKLCGSHDLFFADRKILHLLPRFIGKHFFKSKKTPLPVNFSRKGWPEQIRHCCDSTFLYLRTGTCSGVKVGRVSQGRDEIVDNVMAAVQGAVELIPKKWENIRSLHLKSVESLALPIYQAVPEIGLKIEGLKPAKLALVEDTDGKAKPKLSAGSKKRKGRIHEVDYMDMRLQHGSEDDNDGSVDDELAAEKIDGGEEEKGIDESGVKKKGNKKKKKKQEMDSEATKNMEKKLKRNAGKEEVSNKSELGKRKKVKKGMDKDDEVHDIENDDGKPDDNVGKENGGKEPREKRNSGKDEVSNKSELGKRKKVKKGMDKDDEVHDIENDDGKPDDNVEKENGGEEPREKRARKKKDKSSNGDQADGMKKKQKITRANKSEGKAAKKTRKG